jgi:hypothetical protein
MARLPMTPEDVAASYGEQEAVFVPDEETKEGRQP